MKKRQIYQQMIRRNDELEDCLQELKHQIYHLIDEERLAERPSVYAVERICKLAIKRLENLHRYDYADIVEVGEQAESIVVQYLNDLEVQREMEEMEEAEDIRDELTMTSRWN